MRWIAGGAVASVVLAATALFAYELGGRVGFEHGYIASALINRAMAGDLAVAALRSHDAADPMKAAETLEAQVDEAMITYGAYSDLDLARFDPKRRTNLAEKFARRVAKYRREHPTTTPFGSVRQTVSDTAAALPEPEDCSVPAPQSSVTASSDTR